jgi:acyl-CoA synthetase (AMP-forming)/AMP-acid ligase II
VEVPEGGVELVIAALAAMQLGAVIVFPPPQHRRAGRAAGVRPCARAAAAAAGVVEVLRCGPGADSFDEDTAVLFWTSGSVGEPKGVLLSRRALAYQVGATSERLRLDRSDGLCVPLPLNHAYGFGLLMLWKHLGSPLFLESSMAPGSLLGRLAENRVSSVDGVPSLYARLLDRVRGDSRALAALRQPRIRGCGGDLLSPRLRSEFLGAVGAPLLDGYGLTEAGPNVAIADPDDCERPTAGPPLTGTEVRIAADGEVLVRSPSSMSGYFDDEAGTRAALGADGWLRTGDLGQIDAAGELSLTGRIKQILIVHGQTIPPAVVEDELRGCPGVRDAAVVGIPGDDRRGDRIAAYVEPEDGVRTALSPGDLREACRRGLVPGLVPNLVEIVDRLPRLPSGKVDRRVVGARAASRMPAVTGGVDG